MKYLLGKASAMLIYSGLIQMMAGTTIYFWPLAEFTPLVYLFGIPAFLQGVIHINSAAQNRSIYGYWWVLLVVGMAYLAAGVVTLGYPDLTPALLLLVMATTWSFAGVVMILISVQLNREWENELALLISGILSLMSGIFLVMNLQRSIYSILWVIVCYSFLVGIFTILFGMKARAWQHIYFDDIME